MGNLQKLCVFSAVFFLAGEISAQQHEAYLIESKVDGLFLTVSDRKVPPIGPYDRFGVKVRKLRDNNAQEQLWKFKQYGPNQNEGYIKSLTRERNAITDGLNGDNQYGFYNIYDIGYGRRNYRLLMKKSQFVHHHRTPLCIRNPGRERNNGFIEEVECNVNDDSQLWRFIQN